MVRVKSAVVSLAAIALTVSAAWAGNPRTVSINGEIRGIHHDPGGAVELSEIQLQAGLATVILERGVLVPSTPVAGRPVEFAFVGRGRFELEPPDEVEAGQLELFTGSRTLSEPFERAVFVITRNAAADAVSGGVPAVRTPAVEAAGDLLSAWTVSPERRLLDVEARIFADAVGDGLAAGFFCGVFDGRRLGRFLYVVDPMENEQVALGRFVRPDLSRLEERKAQKTIEKAQREGKLIGLEVADLGIWDTWLSSNLVGFEGAPAPGARGVEPEHYEVDATLAGEDLDLEARVVVDLRVVAGGLRAVAFEMGPDLIPVGVEDGGGRDLDWFRSRNELVAVLNEPAEPGGRIEIRIDYLARPLDKAAGGTWVQRDPTGWYPHVGTIDRATYGLTLQWPEGLDVVASGAPGGRVVRPGGALRQRWRLDRPAVGISFEIGAFEVVTGRAGDVAVSVAVDRTGQHAEDVRPQEILATVIDVMEYYGEIFGPYPLEQLQVVSAPRSYSQGLLGFISLSTPAMKDWHIWGELLGIEDRRTVIAHEVAHQWWGNLVGWESYRDQWISEAMANYAALSWARNRLDEGHGRRLSRGPTAGWRTDLLRPTGGGRPVESLGPLVLGVRLDSSISSSAYRAIVYKKGGLVLDMLSEYFQEDRFVEILRRLVQVASGRVLSTDAFLSVVAGFGGTDLEWFARRYVYGTGLPEITYRYRTEDIGNGRWAVVGTADQVAPCRYRYEVVETALWLDVLRTAEPQFDVSESTVVAPIQIGVSGGGEAGEQRSLIRGRLLVSGESSPFRIEVDGEPGVVWLDRNGEVFGRFIAADRWPRRSGYRRGLGLEAGGDAAGAREAYRRALTAEVAVIPAGWEDSFGPVDAEAEGEGLDARIRLAVARLDLDRGDLASARLEFQRAADLVKSRDRWLLDRDLLVVESRLLLLSGDPHPAFKLLEGRVLGRRPVDAPETWALLAVAAHRVGEDETFHRARDRAAELGVDLGPLAGPPR